MPEINFCRLTGTGRDPEPMKSSSHSWTAQACSSATRRWRFATRFCA